MTKSKLIAVAEAADIIGCSVDHARWLCAEGKMHGWKINQRAWVVERGEALRIARVRSKTGRPRGSKTRRAAK